eukprot:6208271-Pleurochrysis_carterae.AAC.1
MLPIPRLESRPERISVRYSLSTDPGVSVSAGALSNAAVASKIVSRADRACASVCTRGRVSLSLSKLHLALALALALVVAGAVAVAISGCGRAAQLKDIESRILKLLSESTGNILDDEHLINTLAQSKVTSDEISVKAEQARVTEIEIDTTRNEYRPVARRAALLFFCVADMSGVDPMYQYSMPWFVNLFTRAIEDSEKSDGAGDSTGMKFDLIFGVTLPFLAGARRKWYYVTNFIIGMKRFRSRCLAYSASDKLPTPLPCSTPSARVRGLWVGHLTQTHKTPLPRICKNR